MNAQMQYIDQEDITYHVWKELINREGLNVLKMDDPYQEITWPWNTQESRYLVDSRRITVQPDFFDPSSLGRFHRKDGSIDKENLLEFIVSSIADHLVNEASENGNLCIALYQIAIEGETIRHSGFSHDVLVRYVSKITGKE